MNQARLPAPTCRSCPRCLQDNDPGPFLRSVNPVVLVEALDDDAEFPGVERSGRQVDSHLPSAHHQTKHVVSKVNTDKCVGCGLCHIVCHDGANQAMNFDGDKRKAEVDKERCVDCLLCKHVCPVWDCITTEETDGPITGGMHKDAMEFVEKP